MKRQPVSEMVLAAMVVCALASAEQRSPVTQNRRPAASPQLRRPSPTAAPEQSRPMAGGGLMRLRELRSRNPAGIPPWEAPTLAFIGNFDFGRASVPYDTTPSSGLSFSGGIQYQYSIRGLRFAPSIGYQNIFLSRVIDDSGQLESSPTSVQQSLGYLYLQFLLGLRVGYTPPIWSDVWHGPVFWLELGAEYLYPITASQAVGQFPAESFPNQDRPIIGLVGMAADFSIAAGYHWQGKLQVFYNFTATEGSQYFGARLAVAVGLNI